MSGGALGDLLEHLRQAGSISSVLSSTWRESKSRIFLSFPYLLRISKISPASDPVQNTNSKDLKVHCLEMPKCFPFGHQTHMRFILAQFFKGHNEMLTAISRTKLLHRSDVHQPWTKSQVITLGQWKAWANKPSLSQSLLVWARCHAEVNKVKTCLTKKTYIWPSTVGSII